MKDKMRELFTFSAGERKGIIVLIILVILIGMINLLIINHNLPIKDEAYSGWLNDSATMAMPAGEVEAQKDLAQGNLPVDTGDELFAFDPNAASFAELIKLGFSARESRTIIKYRSKGGLFRRPDDLKKIFGLRPSQFARVSNYITIRQPPALPKHIPVTDHAEPPVVDINHADSALLEKLPGIGPVLARRIIKYRSRLGGYYTAGQVKEVFGISDSLYQKIAARLAADTILVKKINLNTATEKELAAHPYIGKYMASGIIRYRSHVFRINSVNELNINGLISDELFVRIKNYLSV